MRKKNKKSHDRDAAFSSRGKNSDRKIQGIERSNDSLEEHLPFERLLSRLSTKFINLPANKVSKEIEHALQIIVELLGIDRSSLYQYRENDRSLHCTHSWAREKDGKVRKKLSGKDYPWIAEKIRKGQIFSFSSIDELPAEAAFDKQSILEKLDLKSALVIPLMVSEKWIGALTFGAIYTARPWPENFIQVAELIGQVFANTLVRKQYEMKLQNAFSEIKQLKKQLESDYTYLREEIESEHDFHEIIGKSSPLKRVLSKIDKVASTDATVLILGETGTGKELVARAIHNRSHRKDRPLVKVNCAALSPSLIESELFGHERGAFTGAHARKLGRFEIADGSTLFLDEIGELPIELQAKLLRVLQEGEFERMGSSHTVKVDARVIAATNRNLEDEVRKERFRRDLLYRLNVFPITVPPLRQRKLDIPLLVNWFVKTYSKKLGKKIKNIPQDVMKKLQKHQWQGNIRELQNAIERAIINTQGPTLQLTDRFGAPEADQMSYPREETSDDRAEQLSPVRRVSLAEMERDYITQILKETNWTIEGPTGAALILDLKPSTLRFRMKKHGMQRPSIIGGVKSRSFFNHYPQ